MTRKLFSFIVFLFGFGISIQASAQTWWTQTVDREVITVERFEMSQDGWQDLRLRKVFLSLEGAQKFLADQGAGPEQINRPIKSERMALELVGSQAKALVPDVLWEAEHKWDLAWETKFSQWIAKEVDPQFWVRNQIATDCADVLYSLRWIFARIHHLEMASRLSGGDFVTHRSVRSSWSQLPTHPDWRQDKRFRAALNYILDNTYTHSLMDDSYPIQIQFGAISEGVYHLDLHRDSGHTQIIARTSGTGETDMPFVIIQSTTPRKIREVSYGGFWYRDQPLRGKGGLLRMRWPVFSPRGVSLLSSNQMPYFSEDQYAKDFLRTSKTSYNTEVYLRLDPNLDFSKVVKKAYESLKTMFQDRVGIVKEGYEICVKSACDPSSSNYDNWSTPSRDARILDLMNQIEALMMQGSVSSSVDLYSPFLEVEGEQYSLEAVMSAWKGKRFSSDPRDVVAKRWGVSAKSLSDFVTRRVNELVAKRDGLLSAGKIAFEVDSELQSIRDQMLNYFGEAPWQQAVLWKNLWKSQEVVFYNEKLSLQELATRMSWLMGDPKLSKDKQSGAQSRAFVAYELGSSMNLQHNATGFSLWTGADRTHRILNHGSKLAQEFDYDGNVYLLREAPVVLKHKGLQIEFVNLVTGESGKFEIEALATEVKIFKNSVVLKSEVPSPQYQILSWNGKSFDFSGWQAYVAEPQIFQPFVSPDMIRGRGFVIQETPQRYVLWSFVGSTPLKISLAGVGVGLKLELMTRETAILNWGGAERWLLRLSDGSHSLISGLKGPVMWSPEGSSGFILNTQDMQNPRSQLFRIDNLGRLTLGEEVLGFPMYQAGGISIQGNGKVRAFRSTPMGLSEETPLSDEKMVLAVHGDFVQTVTHGGKRRIRSERNILIETSMWLNPHLNSQHEIVGMTLAGQDSPASLRTIRHLDEPIMYFLAGMGRRSSHSEVPFGILNYNNQWLIQK